jgi:hypothetical protein
MPTEPKGSAEPRLGNTGLHNENQKVVKGRKMPEIPIKYKHKIRIKI